MCRYHAERHNAAPAFLFAGMFPSCVSDLQKYDFVSGGKARHGVCRTDERIPEADNREGREVGAYVAVYPDAHPLEGV